MTLTVPRAEPAAAPAAPGQLELLAAILEELRALNAQMARLEDDVRGALPFRFRPRR